MSKRCVLISIRPQWCELIANGKKTIEVRKSRPKIPTPFKGYIYCTKASKHLCLMQNEGGVNLVACCDWTTALPAGGNISNGKVIGEFVCDQIYQYSTGNIEGQTISSEEMQKQSCLTYDELSEYENSAEPRENCIYLMGLYGWHISALQIYDKPRELSEFYRYCTEKDDCHKCIHWDSSYDNTYYEPPDPPFEGCMTGEKKHFTRPFQSWGYVEEYDGKR